MLTGKCNDDFEYWLMINLRIPILDQSISSVDNFYELDFSMQYGVYENFFDGVGIVIDLNNTGSYRTKHSFIVYSENPPFKEMLFGIKTRQEAREKAVEKANEIYNELK